MKKQQKRLAWPSRVSLEAGAKRLNDVVGRGFASVFESMGDEVIGLSTEGLERERERILVAIPAGQGRFTIMFQDAGGYGGVVGTLVLEKATK